MNHLTREVNIEMFQYLDKLTSMIRGIWLLSKHIFEKLGELFVQYFEVIDAFLQCSIGNYVVK